MSKHARVLVTGGAGFIGSHVVDCLVGNGYEVRVVDNLSTGKLENIKEHIEEGRITFVRGDLREADFVRKSVQDVDAVIHLAAITSVPFSVTHPSVTHEVNVNGTVNLLNSCLSSSVRKFVFISSCAVYGESQYLPIDEKHPTSVSSPYAASKLEGEELCRNHQEQHGLSTVVLRLFNVYGSRQGSDAYVGVVTRFLNQAKKHLPLVIFGDGLQTRDFVHVRDVTEAVLKAIKTEDLEGEVFNIGFGKATSMNSLAKSVFDLIGANPDIVYEKPRIGDVKASFADISKAKKQLDYNPIVPLEKGLRSLVDESC